MHNIRYYLAQQALKANAVGDIELYGYYRNGLLFYDTFA